ncbi:NADP-dependent oxidoreductase domain-containing protein [Flagelloscypha sp. PMI_526]|nr:NADP-dependent oxidoreductase domain-containing protein [Flagelloscypha sp. PMI_526]
MEYVRLGTSGLKISKIILGCMTYGSKQWQEWVIEGDEAMEHIKVAYDAGVNTFDTADIYSNGESERLLGLALKKYAIPRDDVVILTKLYFAVGKGNEFTVGKTPAELNSMGFVNQYGASRKHIFDSVKKSLERLQVEYVDVLQVHRFDSETPIEETMQALHDVVKAGFARYIGMSSCHAYQFHIMQNYAITHNLTPFISMQNHCNLLYREEEREMFPTLKHFGVGSIPWSPLARGLLTRPQDNTSGRGETDFFIKSYTNRGGPEIVRRVEKIAKDRGITMAQVALAWIMGKEGVSAPIVGTSSIENLKDLLGAVKITLTEEERKHLEEPYEAQGVSGH